VADDAPCFRCGAPSVGTLNVAGNGPVARQYGPLVVPRRATCARCQSFLVQVIGAVEEAAQRSFVTDDPVEADRWNIFLVRDIRGLFEAR
jgi:hypothetical protein